MGRRQRTLLSLTPRSDSSNDYGHGKDRNASKTIVWNGPLGVFEMDKFATATNQIAEELSKLEAAEYIGVCRATFDNYVSNGLIPKGKNHDGTKALFWFKSDLDQFLYKQE